MSRGNSAAARRAVVAGHTQTPTGEPLLSVLVSETGVEHRRLKIDGSVGYVAYNGGGTTLAGFNRALDPFVELTVADHRDPGLTACGAPLVPASFVDNAVQISGTGSFAALPGVYTRQLAALRLETFSVCKLVPRR